MVRSVLAVALALATAACASSGAATEPGAVSVVASTNVYADVVSRWPAASPADGSASTRSSPTRRRSPLLRGERSRRARDLTRRPDRRERRRLRRLRRTRCGARPRRRRRSSTPSPFGRQATQGAPLNEHVWYDFADRGHGRGPRRATALGGRPGRRRDLRRANTAAFVRRLQALAAVRRACAPPTPATRVAITEPVPLYLLTACGLVDRTPAAFSHAVEEGADVPGVGPPATLALFSPTGRSPSWPTTSRPPAPRPPGRSRPRRRTASPAVAVTETLPAGEATCRGWTANLDAVQRRCHDRRHRDRTGAAA